jgi:putative addiction module component (TIGR02574 family)
MTTAMRDLLDVLKQLPPSERAAITNELLLSLEEEEFDPDCETAWAAEIERRMAAVDKGEFSAQPWRKAIEAIRKSLSRKPSS